MQILFALLTGLLLLPGRVHAFGPLTNGGHMIVEELAGAVRVTLQIHRDFLPADALIGNPPMAARRVFEATLAGSPINLGRGLVCTWARPGMMQGDTAVTLQVLGRCPVPLASLEWELRFLKEWPSYFTLYVEARLQSGDANFVLTPDEPMIRFNTFRHAEALRSGLDFVGFSGRQWVGKSGDFQVPPGLSLVLALAVCLMAANFLGDFLAYTLVFLVMHWAASLTANFLPPAAWESWSLDWLWLAAAGAMPLAFLLRRSAWAAAAVVGAVGLMTGLSFPLSDAFEAAAHAGAAASFAFYFNIGSSILPTAAAFVIGPWLAVLSKSRVGIGLLRFAVFGIVEALAVSAWIF